MSWQYNLCKAAAFIMLPVLYVVFDLIYQSNDGLLTVLFMALVCCYLYLIFAVFKLRGREHINKSLGAFAR